MADPVDDTFDSDGVDPNQTLIDALSKPSAKDKSWGRGNYGTNAYNGPSSLTPGNKSQPSSVAASKTDPVLDALATRNAPKMSAPAKIDAHPRGSTDFQTRDVGKSDVPTSFGMHPANERKPLGEKGDGVPIRKP